MDESNDTVKMLKQVNMKDLVCFFQSPGTTLTLYIGQIMERFTLRRFRRPQNRRHNKKVFQLPKKFQDCVKAEEWMNVMINMN